MTRASVEMMGLDAGQRDRFAEVMHKQPPTAENTPQTA